MIRTEADLINRQNIVYPPMTYNVSTSTYSLVKWKFRTVFEGDANVNAISNCFSKAKYLFFVTGNLLSILLSAYYQPSAWPSPINRSWQEAKQEIQARLCLIPAAVVGWEQTGFLCLLLPEGGASWILTWDESKGVSRGQRRGDLGCLCPPSGDGVCIHGTLLFLPPQYPVFAPWWLRW